MAHQLLAGKNAQRGEDVAGHALAGGHHAGTEGRTGAAQHRDCALPLLIVSDSILCFTPSKLVHVSRGYSLALPRLTDLLVGHAYGCRAYTTGSIPA